MAIYLNKIIAINQVMYGPLVPICYFVSFSFDKSDIDGQENNSIKVSFIQNTA